MYLILDKDMIENEIVAYLARPRRGFPPRAPLSEIVIAILYKLKTGVHWSLLPVGALFSDRVLSWQSVYYHYRKWSVTGAWKDCWSELLGRHRPELDLSSVDLDNSHTTAIRGGDKVEYQGQKKRKTTNDLYLTDRQGLYDLRYAIERTNAWMDTFRSLLNRFDTTTESWKGLNYLAFMVMALKKFERNKLEKV